jgi:hypothetical protein
MNEPEGKKTTIRHYLICIMVSHYQLKILNKTPNSYKLLTHLNFN